ncbi:translation initiation factor IF-2 domain protein [Streptomyces sp. GBA 94-10 4N24]|nr:translation initiation factor IF-2 domain protein [Streptomyces sp. GBA 94-10 4N24]ESQ05366.1 translation initiation factor IF-2 domain protein [Streptomyces sp. PVA_94-07]UZN58277.1 translation initiation factor IF-2 domain protein [Streptomyces sp. GBA 94-10 4N24]
MELGHDGLALDAELLGEFVYPDLSHFAPFRSGVRRTVATSWAYSSRTHRVLIAISTYFQLARYLGRAGGPRGALTVLPGRQGSRRPGSRPSCRAVPGRGRPSGTRGGGPPGRCRPARGGCTHPGPAAYRADRGRRRPRPRRCAAVRSWPPAPGIPRTCVQGMSEQASGQTRSSLPPRAGPTPPGQGAGGTLPDLRRAPGRPRAPFVRSEGGQRERHHTRAAPRAGSGPAQRRSRLHS